MTFPTIKSEQDYGEAVDAIEALLPTWFPELAPVDPDDASTWRVGVDVLPDDLIDKLPVVRLRAIGGNDDGLTDYPLVDVDVFHRTPDEAKALAKAIRARLLGAPHWWNGILISRVSTAMRPHSVPWDDQRVARYYGSYVAEVPR